MEAMWSPLRLSTAGTRVVAAVLPTVGDAIAALGVVALARALGARAATAEKAALAYWLFPPLVMNAALWSQIDSFVLAAGVWMVVFLARARWAAAGVALAASVLVKPQGLLFLPVVVASAAVTTSATRSVGVAATLGTAAAAVFAFAMPWMVADGFAWIRRCYVDTAFAFPLTTAAAFNVWYLEALLRDGAPIAGVLDPRGVVAGLSKDDWGRLLFLVAAVTSATLVWVRRLRPQRALVTFVVLLLWSAFVWPTRIHERYIVYCMPFVIALAAVESRLLPATVVLLLAGVVEHSWYLWRTGPPAGSFDARVAWHVYRAAREHVAPREWLATIICLGAYVWTFCAAVGRLPRASDTA
jgi:Gpi18-like mannosyltransferase